ncbi:MAG: hypothetical protein ABI723_21840 [Bacteroidia bacterium]
MPKQQSGNECHVMHGLTLSDEASAKVFFLLLKKKFLNVNGWHQIAGPALSKFILTDGNGNKVNRDVKQGDYFKIDIPGPGPLAGAGYDWVRVEAIEEINQQGEEKISIRVRPAANPTNNDTDVAHFFTGEATSTFEIKRLHEKITAAVYGRNENPNTAVEKLTDKARNAITATGAVNGLAKLQWENLVRGLLQLGNE